MARLDFKMSWLRFQSDTDAGCLSDYMIVIVDISGDAILDLVGDRVNLPVMTLYVHIGLDIITK